VSLISSWSKTILAPEGCGLPHMHSVLPDSVSQADLLRKYFWRSNERVNDV
jgi:hypothetical protein